MGLVVLKVSFLLLLLLGFTTARLDLLTHHHKGYDPSSEPEEAKPCCDSCICTRSMPPQCRCADVRLNSCHSACKRCLCLYSYPGQCQCIDTNDFCYPPCKRSDEDDEDH